MSMSDDELLPAGVSPARRRGPRIGAAVAVAVVVLAGLVWNAVGHVSPSNSRASSTAPSAAAPPAEPVGRLADNGNRCSAQQGGRLMLGIEMTNGTATQVGVERVHVVLPLGGLRPVSLHRSECVWASTELTPFSLEPGQSAWLSAVFDVLVGCPAALPVQFAVDYSWRLSSDIAVLAPSGFADLGEVRYSGCTMARP
jgi:hypothetical protein